MSTQPIQKKRGRKSTTAPLPLNNEHQIVLQQHHFNYSDKFAELLANFASEHLEDKNKEFKAHWNAWTNANAEIIKTEIDSIQQAGYPGSVEEKMYFSARYYYRKKAIRETNREVEEEEEEKSPRKKYEAIDKPALTQMSEHIISQIYFAAKENGVSDMTPSKAFANYCEKFRVSDDDAQSKKKYKNLYWRISKKQQTPER